MNCNKSIHCLSIVEDLKPFLNKDTTAKRLKHLLIYYSNKKESIELVRRISGINTQATTITQAIHDVTNQYGACWEECLADSVNRFLEPKLIQKDQEVLLLHEGLIKFVIGKQ